uniref:DNA topoisomerase n=1 Tax=viral metagenome TaxID=1070528 RepID=A0A6C0IDP9_9ZZZZ
MYSDDGYGSGFLVIVESPSKCAKIEQYLGAGYKVIASKGHITEIESLKSIDMKKNYQISFSLSPSKKSHIKSMREIIDQYLHDRIIIATDNDREGEAIGFHICAVFKLPIETTKRIIFNEITKKALQDAVRNPTVLNISIVQSQHARQVLDMLIGFKISPMLWKYIFHSKSKSLSAGRCQTPALRLIYENHLEGLSRNNGTLSYKTTGYFFPPYNIPFVLKHEYETEDEIRGFLESTRQHRHVFVLHDKEIVTKPPPLPLNTSRLLQSASNLFHISPKTTMQLAQKLYQEGHITYMRTESKQYSLPFLQTAHKYILDKFQQNKLYIGDTARISNEGLQLPHEAIRVTNLETSHIHTNEPLVNSLYHFIWKNTIESCMSMATYSSYKIEIMGAMNQTSPATMSPSKLVVEGFQPSDQTWVHRMESPVFLGWKKIEVSDEDEIAVQSRTHGLLLYLQSSVKKEALLNHVESIVGIRGLHSHYTESGLIQKLEDHGIGRPSTYAIFIETIQERGYVIKKDIEGRKTTCVDFILTSVDHNIETRSVEKIFGNERNKLVIQPLGIVCIEFLIHNFNTLFDYSYTKKLEEELDKITTKVASLEHTPEESDTVTEDGWNAGENVPWYTICEKTRLDILRMTTALIHLQKEVYTIDTNHDFVFLTYGPCIRKHGCENEQGIIDEDAVEFLPIKKSIEIDIDKIKQKIYNIDELIVYKQSYLGKYQDVGVFLRTGPYGHYIEWNQIKKSVTIDENLIYHTVNLEYAIELFEIKPDLVTPETNSDTKIARSLNETMSVRKGQYGNYIFYKTPELKKPIFVNLSTFKEDPLTCDLETIVTWTMTQVNKPKTTGKKFYRKKS